MAESRQRVNRTLRGKTLWARCLFAAVVMASVCRSDDAAERRAANERFFGQSSSAPGLLVPLYVYPADVENNVHWNRLIELKRAQPRVPVCAIVNPASGPGEQVDANYTLGIRRLRGAGIVTLGYVSTHYATIDAATVNADVDRWQSTYPIVNGIFFDEITSQPENGQLEHYAGLTRHAHGSGFWPVFANPGTLVHDDYVEHDAADVFVVHEGAEMPSDGLLKQLQETPRARLGMLVYSQPTFDERQVRRLVGYSRWLYVTEDTLNPQPWDVLSAHSERLAESLSH